VRGPEQTVKRKRVKKPEEKTPNHPPPQPNPHPPPTPKKKKPPTKTTNPPRDKRTKKRTKNPKCPDNFGVTPMGTLWMGPNTTKSEVSREGGPKKKKKDMDSQKEIGRQGCSKVHRPQKGVKQRNPKRGPVRNTVGPGKGRGVKKEVETAAAQNRRSRFEEFLEGYKK